MNAKFMIPSHPLYTERRLPSSSLLSVSGKGNKKPADDCPPVLLDQEIFLRFASAAQNSIDLVGHHIFDSGTGRGQVLTRVKVAGILSEVFADGAGHC